MERRNEGREWRERGREGGREGGRGGAEKVGGGEKGGGRSEERGGMKEGRRGGGRRVALPGASATLTGPRKTFSMSSLFMVRHAYLMVGPGPGNDAIVLRGC